MFHNTLTFCRTLLLAGAVVVLTAGAALARGGGGHGGGGFAGGHGGGFHGGGFGGGHFGGGFHGGGFGGGFNRGFHNGGRFFPHSRGFGFAYPGYSSYAYPYYSYSYPYYYDPGSYSYAYTPYYSPDLSSGLAYNPGYSAPYSYQPALASPGGSALGSPAPDTAAHVTVNVPADAGVWFDGNQTRSTGPVREFISPSLTPGQWYAYEVRARWHKDGREVTQTRTVAVTAGAHLRVDFSVPTGTTAKPSMPEAR
jgi:uncharacterized protein (TIGR03000 family)